MGTHTSNPLMWPNPSHVSEALWAAGNQISIDVNSQCISNNDIYRIMNQHAYLTNAKILYLQGLLQYYPSQSSKLYNTINSLTQCHLWPARTLVWQSGIFKIHLVKLSGLKNGAGPLVVDWWYTCICMKYIKNLTSTQPPIKRRLNTKIIITLFITKPYELRLRSY